MDSPYAINLTGATCHPYEKVRRVDVPRLLSVDAPAVPWVVQPVAARGMLTMLCGRAGAGKSLFTQAIMDAVASGESLAGLGVGEPGRVVVIDAENGVGELHRRVKALALGGAMGTQSRAPHRISLYEAEGLDLACDMAVVEEILKLERPALLVLDSWRSLWSGSEWSRAAAHVLRKLQLLLRRYDCAGLLLHHLTRDRQIRGSTMVEGVPEMLFEYGRAKDDSDRGRRFLAPVKFRCGEEPPTRWLRIAVEGSMLVVDAAEPPATSPEAERPVRDRILESVFWTIAMSEDPINRSDIARRLERDPKDRSVGRCLDELVSLGRLLRDDAGFYCVAETAQV